MNNQISIPKDSLKLIVKGHILADKVLLIVLNNADHARPISFKSALRLWFPTASSFSADAYNHRGTQVSHVPNISPGIWQATTPPLQPLELFFYVVSSH